MGTAIYCRVSTEDQEKEGTSLDSQAEAGIKKARVWIVKLKPVSRGHESLGAKKGKNGC